MLSNHLIFNRRSYNKRGLVPLAFFLAILTSSCSTKRSTQYSDLKCDQKTTNIDQRMLIMSSKAHAKDLANCFSNYIKFEVNKRQEVGICSHLVISKNGQVTYVQVNGLKKKISKDLEMCFEQEYWKKSFSKLQPKKETSIKFSLVFSSI